MRNKNREMRRSDVRYDMGNANAGQITNASESKFKSFHAEEQTLSPSNGVPSIVKLNEYLNTYHASHPDAALLQMIPTAPNTYLFVWEA